MLQTRELPLSTRLQALQCLAQLLQLPPNICQPTRCSLLKAAFSTIFSSFLEHEDSKEPVNICTTIELTKRSWTFQFLDMQVWCAVCSTSPKCNLPGDVDLTGLSGRRVFCIGRCGEAAGRDGGLSTGGYQAAATAGLSAQHAGRDLHSTGALAQARAGAQQTAQHPSTSGEYRIFTLNSSVPSLEAQLALVRV